MVNSVGGDGAGVVTDGLAVAAVLGRTAGGLAVDIPLSAEQAKTTPAAQAAAATVAAPKPARPSRDLARRISTAYQMIMSEW